VSRINLSTTILAGPQTEQGPLGAQIFIPGLTLRGSLDRPPIATSYDDLVEQVGPAQPYGNVHEEARLAFAAGASRVVVCRAVGPAATVATVTVNDRAAVPVATMRFDGADPGAWAAAYDVRIEDAAIAGAVRVIVVQRGVRDVEIFDNLRDRQQIVDALRSSRHVRATALATATAPPADMPAAGTYALAGGSDDRAAVTAAMIVAALDRATWEDYGPGLVTVPGFVSTGAAGAVTVGAAVKAHCLAFDRIAYLHEAAGATDPQLLAAAAALRTDDPTDTGRVVTIVGPWVQTRTPVGALRDVPPTGYLGGLRARAHLRVGPHQWPAGELALTPRVPEVVDVTRRLTAAQADALEAGGVTPLRALPGGVRPAGYACCAVNRVNWPTVAEADVVHMIRDDVDGAIGRVQFTPVDGRGQFLAKVAGLLEAIAHRYLLAGALFENVDETTGETLDRGYRAEVSKELNPLANLARQRVRARLAVRPAPTAATFDVEIVKAGLTASLGG
jgi:hypothetical protein